MNDNKKFEVKKMTVEKWYMCDGGGQVKPIQHSIEKTQTEKHDQELPKEDKIVPIEPEWKQEDPKNCFNPWTKPGIE